MSYCVSQSCLTWFTLKTLTNRPIPKGAPRPVGICFQFRYQAVANVSLDDVLTMPSTCVCPNVLDGSNDLPLSARYALITELSKTLKRGRLLHLSFWIYPCPQKALDKCKLVYRLA